MTDINIADLTVEQLQKLKADIEVASQQRRQTELVELRTKVDDLIDNSPFTLEEVLEARKLRKPVAPKYRHPEDSSMTWTGRGRRPRWVDECLDNGQSLEDLAI
ncbi:MAG: H-NS family nucleoid-associated regulatory protein [Thiolinea sp.]